MLVDGRVALEKLQRLTGRRYPLLQDVLDVVSADHQQSFREMIEDVEEKVDKARKS